MSTGSTPRPAIAKNRIGTTIVITGSSISCEGVGCSVGTPVVTFVQGVEVQGICVSQSAPV